MGVMTPGIMVLPRGTLFAPAFVVLSYPKNRYFNVSRGHPVLAIDESPPPPPPQASIESHQVSERVKFNAKLSGSLQLSFLMTSINLRIRDDFLGTGLWSLHLEVPATRGLGTGSHLRGEGMPCMRDHYNTCALLEAAFFSFQTKNKNCPKSHHR